MYDERCKHCGAKETQHDIYAAIRDDSEFTDEERTQKILEELGGEPTCEKFESEIEHAEGCPVFLTERAFQGTALVDIYCQELPGKCAELLLLQRGIECIR